MFKKGVKLQFAISLLVIMTVISTILVSWYSSTKALNEKLSENYLESNYNYVKKLSLSTKDLINYMQGNMNALGKIIGNHDFGQSDLDTWHSANENHFNSIFLTDAQGVIQLVSPSVIQFQEGAKVKAGTQIKSDTMKKALSLKEPFISKPYRATSGQLIILISSPVFDDTGAYKGLIGGTIHLESENVLKSILNKHEYADGSYVYVVDNQGRIIYHPDRSRLNDIVLDNEVVKELSKGESGATRVTNTKDNEFFAGYTYEENTGWGIVSQTPVSVIDGPLKELFQKMALQSLPLLLLILFIAGFLVKNILKPLNTLAKLSEDANNSNKLTTDFKPLQIKSYIYEVDQLYHQVNNHLSMLNTQIQIDGLTGIANRKTFDSVITDWIDQKVKFSLIMIDIDHFKKVNDTYGHLLGDEVLKYLSALMVRISREDDLCFRYGGEEFGILVKGKHAEDAFKIAERLRTEVANSISPTGKAITISLGVTSFEADDQHPKTIIERADTALYQSKSAGRNRTTIYREKRSTLLAR